MPAPRPAPRDQGVTLDLHEDTGQKAFAIVGLLDAFRTQAHFEDPESRLLDYATARILFQEIPGPGEDNRAEIDRKVLRDLLLESLEPGTVTWGARLQEVIAQDDGRYRLRFRP